MGVTWTVEGITRLTTAYWDAAAVAAAVELGLFDALGRGETTATEAAHSVGTSPEHTGRLLDALCGLGLLQKQDGRYRIEESAVQFLSRSSPVCLLDALRLNSDLYPLWSRLAECVRAGRPAVNPGGHLGADPERTRRFVVSMHGRALAMAPVLLPALPVRDGRRLLDLASGPGTFSRLLAERMTRLEVTQFDLPGVVAIARELTAQSPAASRIRFREGDYRRDALPGDFDTVFFCGAIHQETPESAEVVLAKAASALRPGGEMLLVDLMVEADGTRPAFSALFSLNMMLTSQGGRVHAEADLVSMLGRVGFCQVRSIHPSGCPYAVVCAVRQ
jgi:2-polyprenyl-3-methyl-5-hydroxy-6-metoxy-1,4-benzoquinol methylase